MRVTLLAGGTGGTKLAHGFSMLPQVELTVIANVGDDVEMHGLLVCPDIDALLYTLAGLVDADRGWGVRGDTHTAHDMFERLGEPTWFRIGDADLATHAHRTRLLRDEGASLTDAVATTATALGIGCRILPATDDRWRTLLDTDAGPLEFQEYFVRRRQEPAVLGVRFAGDARPTSAVLEAIATADLVVIGPSNPIVSIGPILAVPGLRDALAASGAVKIGISPIVGGKALKGPADRMLASLGHEPTAIGVARIYAELLDVFVIDEVDRELAPGIESLGLEALVAQTVMGDRADRERLAGEVLAAARGAGSRV